jgi:hypothetical protein
MGIHHLQLTLEVHPQDACSLEDQATEESDYDHAKQELASRGVSLDHAVNTVETIERMLSDCVDRKAARGGCLQLGKRLGKSLLCCGSTTSATGEGVGDTLSQLREMEKHMKDLHSDLCVVADLQAGLTTALEEGGKREAELKTDLEVSLALPRVRPLSFPLVRLGNSGAGHVPAKRDGCTSAGPAAMHLWLRWLAKFECAAGRAITVTGTAAGGCCSRCCDLTEHLS